jgi:thioredoxin-dependent peroxiredoxin
LRFGFSVSRQGRSPVAKVPLVAIDDPMRLKSLLLAVSFLSLFSFARAEPLKVGDAAPVQTVTVDDGSQVNLGDVYKKGHTLFWFYPKANTGGCTAQGCSLRDSNAEITKRGVQIFGVSADDVAEQRSFREKQNYPFPLIADADKKLISAFGESVLKFGGRANRTAYLVDHNGKIIWRDAESHTKDQAEHVLAALDKLGIK